MAEKDPAFADRRLLVIALEGWNDAGEAATTVATMLREQLSLTELDSLDPEEFFDYQFNRPSVARNAEGEQVITWPTVALFGHETPQPKAASLAADADMSVSATGGENVYLLTGSEPSRRWKAFASYVINLVSTHEIDGVVMLGALLADVPHTRPISVFASSEDPAIREELGVERSNYEGPTGILGILADAAHKAGIPVVSIWASVPHYVHHSPSPKATLAIVDKLEEIIDTVIARGDLSERAAEWQSGIDEIAEEDDEMTAYIAQLEKARDTVDAPEASGEAIAKEFERFLRGDDPRGQQQ